tara:strand:- start:6799 stop:8202 length:1404 start_codon:yes stop_codon:yes gene_type:complete
MAIQQFGESLLGDIRKRRQDEERRNRKRADREALLGLGVNLAAKVGNEMLANKAQDFLKKEEFLLGQQVQNKAFGYASQLNNYRSAIQKGGEGYSSGDTIGYAMTQFKPEFEARAKETLSNTYTNDLTAYNAKVRQETKKLAEEWASDYDKAILLADEVLDKDSYSAMVKLNATKAKPTNMGDYVTRGISKLFGGKSEEEFEQEAFEAITDEMEDAEELTTFMSTFKSFGDMTRAYEFTKQVFPEAAFSPDKTTQVTETPDVRVIDDKIFVGRKVKTADLITKDVREEVVFDTDENNRPVPLVDTTDPEEAMQKLLKQKNDTYNYGVRAFSVLKPEAFEGFMAAATALSLKPENPSTLNEYNEIGKLYRTWLKGNVQDPAAEQLERELIDIVTTGIITTKLAGEQLSGLPDDQIIEKTGQLLFNMLEGTRVTLEKYGETQGPNVPPTLDFTGLLQEEFREENPYIAR